MDAPRQPGDASPRDADGVAVARRKFDCPACGGEAQWNPAKQALTCPYCGTESPAELIERDGSTVIVEHDLALALRDVAGGTERGWDAEKISAKCQSCHAVSIFDPNKISQSCQFCGSTALVPYEDAGEAIRPESLLPMQVAESKARDVIRAWYGRQWLAPNGFAGKAMTDTVKGLYLPYWTFDAKVHASWTAESGQYYYVRTGGKQERRVRWSPAAGELSHAFDDDLVCASIGVHTALIRSVEPFPTATLIPYDPGYLSGWTVERYQLDLVASAARSRSQMDAVVRQLCANAVPGDTHRNLVVRSTYSGQTFKHILVPVWLLSYVYRSKSFQVVVNGVTGETAGERPWSWIKIALLILLALIVLVTIQALNN